ncbi:MULTISPECIES: helix-turn-helix domain-containing protein [unclassified Streptomyces]|uniref:helix-turn-helix domain-containing protein n=1 Tax=unclassified Streptomyces TaxID=2593676 RepID=UPI0018EE5381|nr:MULTISPECIES: helix-turn-helix transcriptional regulator [unclassified Streptomyces]MBJ6613933.1 helix-turn-helix transcriptional regulator [Streptomyces sp. I3(2020)]MBJ6630226.1 helix-turn-helix transcriptional regulator [Streptomyces sp. I4(2020)]WPP32262.1 helix-turn-helix transcriptional regulator [Streptomyces sp. CL7]
MVDETDDFDALLESTSLGGAGARKLRSRTPVDRARAVRTIAHLRNRIVHDPAHAAAAAQELVELLESLGREAPPGPPPASDPGLVGDPTKATSFRQLVGAMEDLRLERGLTYKRLSQRSSLSMTTWSDVLHGKRAPSLAVVDAFVRACGGGENDLKVWRESWYRVWVAEVLADLPGQEQRAQLAAALTGLMEHAPELAMTVGHLLRLYFVRSWSGS